MLFFRVLDWLILFYWRVNIHLLELHLADPDSFSESSNENVVYCHGQNKTYSSDFLEVHIFLEDDSQAVDVDIKKAKYQYTSASCCHVTAVIDPS